MSAGYFAVNTEKLLYGITMLLAAGMPFGFIQPVLFISRFDFTNIEILIVITALVWIVHLMALMMAGNLHAILTRNWRLFPLVSAVMIFLFVSVLSVVFAPDHHSNALNATTRFFIGVYLMVLVIYITSTPQRVVGVMWAFVAGAGVSALLGIGEALAIMELNRVLLLFKTAPSRVGGVLRVSATFQYTTIASMYFEMAIPLAVVLWSRTSNRYARMLAFLTVVMCTVAIVLTLTRSGMGVVFVLGVLGVGMALWRFRAMLLPSVMLLAALFIAIGLLFLNEEAFRARITTEDDTNWYNAVYIVPDTLTLEVGIPEVVQVEVQNIGEVVWRSFGEHAYRLGYYWESVEDNASLDMAHTEVGLPHNLAPGEGLKLEIEVKPRLPPGEYRMVWGMLQANVLWFRHRDVPESRTSVEITPSTQVSETLSRPQLSNAPPGGHVPTEGPAAVSRIDLWRAAFAMWLQRPLFGVGPDNFRLLYGAYLGYDVWYEGNHSNNLYIELLATTGIFGFIAFFGFIGVLLAHLKRMFDRLRLQNTPQTSLLVLGLAGCLLAFFLHGFFDYFLPWLPTLGLFWMSAGCIASLAVHTGSATAEPLD